MNHLQQQQQQQLEPISEGRSKRLLLALILGTLSAFGPFSLDMYLPALPILAGDLHTTASYAQLSLTACMLGLAIGQIFAGPISDIIGRRKPLLVGLILYIAVSIFCLMAPSIEAFIILRFIQGTAGAVGIVISRAIVRDMYSGTELTKFFALLTLINGAAPIIAPVAGGQLLAFTDWRGVFFALAILGVMSLLMVIFFLKETLPAERRMQGGLKNTFSAFKKIIRDRQFMGYALAQGLVGAAMFAYIAGSPFVLQNLFNLSPQMFSVCFAINGVGIICASQITGRLAGRVSETKLLVAGLVIAAAGGVGLLVNILLNTGLFGVLIPLFLIVSCVGIVNTATFSLAMENQGKNAGSASALIGLMTFLLGGLVAPLVGIGGEDSALAMGIVIACAEIAALSIYFILVRGARESTIN
ncbi:multidrug effflux MFS transporter [Cytobacillus purgationiresistens]|uniref:Bcr/CflA family efflux transporter n=1 Tax=Cytobacillus purgationiresistens TaxID=863449 RepID=A0ABU0AR86_9BACI|nr:multidrug effflux MFS transporter [Cytobacillus purgationiresistens]MDQ0273791.1 DHA1 family bicyclomycin/chloramphenicol resistance-like MFS transporter [Cytobacillus purgationiresistens]